MNQEMEQKIKDVLKLIKPEDPAGIVGFTDEWFDKFNPRVLAQYPTAVAHREKFGCSWTIKNPWLDHFVIAKAKPKWTGKYTKAPQNGLSEMIMDASKYSLKIYYNYAVQED